MTTTKPSDTSAQIRTLMNEAYAYGDREMGDMARDALASGASLRACAERMKTMRIARRQAAKPVARSRDGTTAGVGETMATTTITTITDLTAAVRDLRPDMADIVTERDVLRARSYTGVRYEDIDAEALSTIADLVAGEIESRPA